MASAIITTACAWPHKRDGHRNHVLTHTSTQTHIQSHCTEFRITITIAQTQSQAHKHKSNRTAEQTYNRTRVRNHANAATPQSNNPMTHSQPLVRNRNRTVALVHSHTIRNYTHTHAVAQTHDPTHTIMITQSHAHNHTQTIVQWHHHAITHYATTSTSAQPLNHTHAQSWSHNRNRTLAHLLSHS